MAYKKLRAGSPSIDTDQDRLNRFDTACADYQQVLSAVTADREMLGNMLWKQPQGWRRTSMRQFFAEDEAKVYQIGRILLAAHEAHLIQLSSADFSILIGVQYRLCGDGQTELRNDIIRRDTNLLFIVRLCGDYCGSARTVNKRASDWKNYRIASRIHDGLIHPKDFSDYEITDDSWKVVHRASTWIHGLIKDLNKSLEILLDLADASED